MMNRTHFYPVAARPWHQRPLAPGAIEWEELPSLAQTLRRSDFAFRAGSVWLATQRMDLQSLAEAPAPAPFAEPIGGLHVREIDADEVFRHFFGDPSANH
jgi:hypothetical protein